MKTTDKKSQEELLQDTFAEEVETEEVEEIEVKGEEEKEEEVKKPKDKEESKEEQEEESSEADELEAMLLGPDAEAIIEEEEEAETEKIEELSFDLTSDEFEELTTDKDKFQDYIKKVYDSALKTAKADIQQAVANAQKEILTSIPDVVSKSASRTQEVKTLISDFYKNNPHLADKRAYVQDMAAAIGTKNPDWSADKILDEIANRAKRDLGAVEAAEKREKERRSDDPLFAGAGGRRAPGKDVDTRTQQQKLMDETFG